MPNSETKKKIKWQIPVLIIIAILSVIYLIFRFTFSQTSQFEKAKSEWQAVFLSNSQIYFGKIVTMADKEVVLRDVYYLPTDQTTQGPKEGHVVSAQTPFLIKLGSEFYKPYDEMRINRDHVLFIEDLKSDSPVIEAIKQYQSE